MPTLHNNITINYLPPLNLSNFKRENDIVLYWGGVEVENIVKRGDKLILFGGGENIHMGVGQGHTPHKPHDIISPRLIGLPLSPSIHWCQS